MIELDLVVIGGGPAGLAAAIKAKEEGINNILILERENKLGGILNQCIHNGFGLHTFKEELTGPEYAQRFIDKAHEMKIPYKLNTTVLDLNKAKIITAVNEKDGILEIKPKSVILAMGCRERPRGAISIPGTRCAGIFTAGTAQKFVNLEGYMPGKEVVILGSGDIGLIMARRMTLEGANVKAVIELMPYSGGLRRNIVQCLEDYNIPLMLEHTITNIIGKERVEGVTIAKVDKNKIPLKETEQLISCDTILLSVGLVPENELTRKADIKLSQITGGAEVDENMETSMEGVFACGNVLHVHDLVDFVTTESYNAGKNAALYINENSNYNRCKSIEIKAIEGVRYTVPQNINIENINRNIEIKYRVSDIFKDSYISVYIDDIRELHIKKKILTPGQMETLILPIELLKKHRQFVKITFKVEKE